MPQGHEERLIRYLLGDLPPAEEEAVEEAYVSGRDAFPKLQAAEEDLIDAYVSGTLSEADRRRFQDHFLISPGRRERTAFARALARSLGPAPRRRPRPWLPVAAVLAGGLVGSAWLLSRVRQLDEELQRAQTGREAASRADQDSQRRAAELDRQIARLRRELAGAEGSAAMTPWVLTPGLERGATPSPVPLSPATDWVRLRLQLEDDEHPRYRVAVSAAEGQVVARFDRLRSQAAAGGRVVEIVLPAAALEQGTYVVALAGVSARGAPEAVASYPLRVVRSR